VAITAKLKTRSVWIASTQESPRTSIPQLHLTDSRPEALYNLESGSWLAWADDTAAHYAAIHCPLQRTVGPAVAASRDTTTPISHTRPSPHSR